MTISIHTKKPKYQNPRSEILATCKRQDTLGRFFFLEKELCHVISEQEEERKKIETKIKKYIFTLFSLSMFY